MIFSLQEADLGFHLIIDRRNDKWNSVKTVLLKISVSIYTYEIYNYSSTRGIILKLEVIM